MKRISIVLALLAFVAVPSASLGQGLVLFQNTSQTLIRSNTAMFGGTIGPIIGLRQYRIGLYAAAPGTTDEGAFSLIAVATNSSLQAGRFAYPGGTVNIPGNAETPIAFQVRAWTLAGGGSYEDARLAALAAIAGGDFFSILGGTSSIGTVTPYIAGSTPELFGTNPGQVSGFDVKPFIIPEPSSIALGLLGLGAIALFRRRK